VGRAIGRLKAVEINRLVKKAGMHCDGGGLYLRVVPPTECSWIFRYMLAGRARTMGLGPFPEVTLAQAREKSLEARRLKIEGKDPIEEKRSRLTAAALAGASAMTFKHCGARYIAAHKAGWKNAKHASQWEATLETYVYGHIGALPVQAIDTGLVLKVLEPIWSTKVETAGRVRGRIEAILDWAKARGQRTGENPARWRGHLDKLLPGRSKVSKVMHHPALPYGDLPAFLAELRGQAGIGARALEFTILTAARTGEVLEATWVEIDADAKVWTIPAGRMKADKEHRVLLSESALAILKHIKSRDAAGTEFIFSGGRPRRRPGSRSAASTAIHPLSNMAMTTVLRRMNDTAAKNKRPKWIDPRQGKEVVPHGFRSTFRDWAAEATMFPGDMAEMALAHAIDSKVEAAYRRGDMMEKRRELMAAWDLFCTGTVT
jgi:integrase